MDKPAGDGIVYSSLDSLLLQRSKTAVLKRGRKVIKARQQGGHLSVQKGRGMDFAESRLYAPGDDVRMLDWKVIARTGKPHTKVFQEERERPVVFWVDFRASMFFATRNAFKSVIAAETASLLAWKSWGDGDRVGGILTLPGQHLELKPARSKSGVLQFIHMLSDGTKSAESVKINNQEITLGEEWRRLRRVVSTGAQVVLISDFRGVDQIAEQQLVAIARHASLNIVVISDPFEHQLPEKGLIRVTDGRRFKNILFSHKETRQSYLEQAQVRADRIVKLARKYQASVTWLSTQDDPQDRLMKLARGFA